MNVGVSPQCVGGRLRRFTIGLYPRISLAGARETARDALRDAHHGKDCAAEKIEVRRAETFAELATEYIERHAKQKRSGCGRGNGDGRAGGSENRRSVPWTPRLMLPVVDVGMFDIEKALA